EGDRDTETVAIAGAIIRQRTGNFDPSTYRDRYQEALQQLIEAKMKGVTIEPRAVSTPSPVIDLMAALKLRASRRAPHALRGRLLRWLCLHVGPRCNARGSSGSPRDE